MALLVGATVAFVTWPDGHATQALAHNQTRNPLGTGVALGGFLAVVVAERRALRWLVAFAALAAALALSAALPVTAALFAALLVAAAPALRRFPLELVTAAAIALVAALAFVPKSAPTPTEGPLAASTRWVAEGNLYRALAAARAAAALDGAVPAEGTLQLARVAAALGDDDDARALAARVAAGTAAESTRQAAASFLAGAP